jgi:UPF0755 protein
VTGRRAAAAALGVAVATVAVAAGWFWWQVHPPGRAGEPVRVTVRPGAGVAEIADTLARAGVIGSPLAFRVYTRVAGRGPYHAGTFPLARGAGAAAAADRLERPAPVRYRRLALPPGLTLTEIAARVGALPGLSAPRFLAAAASGRVRSRFAPPGVASLEGLTWPDTYLIAPGETEQQVLARLVRLFDRRAARLGLDRAPDPYAAVIIASLVQGEARLDEERPVIAGVVANRLAAGMPLQIDATVVYARGTREGPLRREDFERDSPWNTYRVPGLPPTPIATVAPASLRAALAPAEVPYLYYVLADRRGRHAFAVTYEEHLRNVAESRRKGLL